MKYFMILFISLCVILCQVARTIIIHDLKVPYMVILGDDDDDDDDHKRHYNYKNNDNEIIIKDNTKHIRYDNNNDNNNDNDDDDNDNNDNNDDDDKRIKLDCLYDLENERPTSLVVKWYMNNNLIYQWIRDQQPSVTPYLREHIDDIEITSIEPNHRYRGLTLKHLSIELNGLYKCLVQTENDSKFREEELNIIDLRNYTISFNHKHIENESHLECSITNIYPEPRIHFNTNDDNVIYKTPLNITILDNGYYEASMRAIVQTNNNNNNNDDDDDNDDDDNDHNKDNDNDNDDDDDDDDDDDNKYHCYITFPNLPYNLTVQINNAAIRYQHPYRFKYEISSLILFSLYIIHLIVL